MLSGLWFLCVFAAVWGVAGLVQVQAPRWMLLLPPALSAAVILLGYRLPLRASRAALPGEGARIARLVGLWSGVEGLAIFAAINVLMRSGRTPLILPAVAVIVGLHFFPLAHGIPERTYWAAGALMVSAGVLGALAPGGPAPAATAFACALVLWGECAVLLVRARA